VKHFLRKLKNLISFWDSISNYLVVERFNFPFSKNYKWFIYNFFNCKNVVKNYIFIPQVLESLFRNSSIKSIPTLEKHFKGAGCIFLNYKGKSYTCHFKILDFSFKYLLLRDF